MNKTGEDEATSVMGMFVMAFLFVGIGACCIASLLSAAAVIATLGVSMIVAGGLLAGLGIYALNEPGEQ